MTATDYLMITSIRINGEPNLIIEATERCFMRFGDIIKRGPFSVSAQIYHPDGLTVKVKSKLYYDEVLILETQRRSGDALLFQLVYRLLTDFMRNYDKGFPDMTTTWTRGQIIPAASRKMF